jgi:phage tail sheath gpL-like
VTITITETTMPAGDADMAAAISNLNGMGFSGIVAPYCNTTVISELTTYFNESTGQWSPIIGHGGVWFSGLKGTSAAISSFTDALNDPYGSIVGIPTSTSQPEYLVTTAFACAVMQSAAAAPQLPFQGIVLQGIQPWTTDFARPDRVLMLNSGASTLKVKNGQVVIDRVISLYETNSLGYADTSYLNLNVALQLMVVNSYITNYLDSLYPRKAIVANGTPINASNNFTTPQAIGASAGVAYSQLCDQGICQNAAVVQKGITTSYANGQVSIFLPAQLTGQLEVIAINLTFTAG